MKKPSGQEALSRREVLKGLLLGATGLALGDGFGTRPGSFAWADEKTAPAKAVIQIWMWGGPSHLDTFDPKPDAGRDYCGPLTKAIPTKAPGILISELLPLMAKQADKYAIIRGMTHGINAHETASYAVQTGREPGRLVYPCAGAVVSLFKGYDRGYKGLVPPYIVLTEPQGRFSESGFLGQKYKPFATGGDPSKTPFAVEGIVAPGVTDERQRARRELLHKLDTLGNAIAHSATFNQFDQTEKNAYDLMFGEARKIFDLAEEKDELRERYGRNAFGQACLTARRLVERGVPYVTINYKGWDTHKQHFESMRRKLPELDAGFATLLQDLSDRGLLGSTIVWWGGEFGRTPKIDWDPPWNGGRGHFGACFSSVLAGGGFKGGQALGASDAKGMEVRARPVHPRDLLASVYRQLGIDPHGPLPNPAGLEVKVMDFDAKDKPDAGLLNELI